MKLENGDIIVRKKKFVKNVLYFCMSRGITHNTFIGNCPDLLADKHGTPEREREIVHVYLLKK